MSRGERFRGKVIWITGASAGIGEVLARRFSEMGAKLVLSSNETDELERVRDACAKAGAHAMALFLDLSKAESMASKAAVVLERFGRVDYLFNNGGISQRSLAVETSLEVDRKIMEIDYFGQIALTKALLPSMIEHRSGHIVVTTSVSGILGVPMRSAYCAAKHALHGFFDSLRAEVHDHGIRVTLVAPSAVQTRISTQALTGDGGTFGKMDKVIAKGISPEACADGMIDAVVRGKEEVVLGKGTGKYGVIVKRHFPRVYSKLVRRATVV